jgi:hypothetical protein
LTLLALSSGALHAQTLPRILFFEEALRGTEDQELRCPVGVAVASEEQFGVADALPPRFVVFRKVGVSWQLANTFRLPAAPVGLAYDGDRYVVSLRGGEGLLAFEGEQLLMRKIGIPDGVVPGAVAARDGGGLLLYDFASRRVLQLDSKGDRIAETAIEGQVTGLDQGANGAMWVAVGDESAVLHYDANGALVARLEVPGEGPMPAWPAGLVAGGSGELAVVDRHAGRIVIFDRDGIVAGVGARRGSEPGLLMFPRDVTTMPDGRVLVADEGNGRVQAFRRTDQAGSP